MKIVDQNGFNEALNNFFDERTLFCCKMVGPVLEELDAENDQLTIVKVNVDNELDLASKYGVQSIPNMIFFKEGKAVTQIIGFANKDAILDKINPFMD